MNETYFEQLLQWLARCPALTGIDLRVDDLPPAAGMRWDMYSTTSLWGVMG